MFPFRKILTNFFDNKKKFLFEEKINEILNFVEKEGFYPEIRILDKNEPETFVNGKKVLLFCSLNYLNLANHPKVKEAAIRAIKRYGVGAGGSRFVSGNFEIHNILEKKIAEFKREEAGLILHTGYVANVGIIPALMNFPEIGNFSFFEKKVIFSDELNHASIIDGCKLSKAKVVIYKHSDMHDLETKLKKFNNARKLIITDSVFSMDGDIAPLPQIVKLAKEYNAITMIDEAHASGILGERGSGATEYFHLEGKIDVVMGTFSKAFGCLGAYVVGKKNVIKYLKAANRPSIFSVFLPPSIVAAILAALEEIKNNKELREKVLKNADYLRSNLKRIGFNTLRSETQIIPILIGSEKKAIQFAKFLLDNGFYAPDIRWPAVPKQMARIRFTVMAKHTKEQIDKLLNACEDIGKKLKII